MHVRLLAPGLIVFSVALLASGVLEMASTDGVASSTLVLLPVVRLLMFLTGAVSLAGALVRAFFGGDRRSLRIGAFAALGFSASSFSMIVLTLADVLAASLSVDPVLLRSFVTQIDEGRYLLMQALLGILAAWLLSSDGTLRPALAAMGLGIAVLLPAFTGHSASAVTHWLASATMVLHLASMHVWLGGVVLLVLVPTREAILGVSGLASLAMPTLLGSGLASVVARVNDWASFWHDRYAAVLAAKVAVALAIVWFGRLTRQRIVDNLAVAPSGTEAPAATRMALRNEGSLMLVALGLAVILARMPNP